MKSCAKLVDPNAGRPKFGLSMPKEDFMENIENYKFIKFLDIGNNDNLILINSNISW